MTSLDGRALAIMLAFATLGVGAISCGGTNRASSYAVAPVDRHLRGDEDDDEYQKISATGHDDQDSDTDKDIEENAHKGYLDGDDSAILTYGHPAAASVRRTITELVARYYATAATGDGATACTMLESTLADSIAEDLGQSGPRYMRGAKTCAAVTSRLFTHEHQTLTALTHVTGVRQLGQEARVTIGSTTLPAGYVILKEEHNHWKIASILAVGLP